ncbi:hypothetical protein DUI87_23919 [Hirundo rustica rustica]|uniref:Uncharacterized protein n=1 Tax=Hirundo rustica rustica TaxID=333673 RepID=A0A3M0JF72_HIRRU|nr:hypothetical protein DUI87_23919 [Hirundo rustica rustica]
MELSSAAGASTRFLGLTQRDADGAIQRTGWFRVENGSSGECLIPLITYVVQNMPVMTMPTHPESETMEKRQKMMVLRTIKEDKNSEKAFKIYERYQYAKSAEVQKL